MRLRRTRRPQHNCNGKSNNEMEYVCRQNISKQNILTILKIHTLVVVPYTSNPRFIGRSDTLEKLKNLLGSNLSRSRTGHHARAALFGLGGIGYA